MSKQVTLLFIIVLSVLILLVFEAAPVSAYTKPSVPDFTAKYEANLEYVPPTYSVDRYTGEKTLTSSGHYVENKSVVLTIRNQNFSPYTDDDDHYITLSYNVRVKGHYEDGWTSLSGHIVASDDGNTVTSYAIGENAVSEILRNVPDRGELDFQVEALIGYYTRTMPECYQYNEEFTGETSGWSSTRTVMIGETQTPAPSPTTSTTPTPTPAQTSTPTQPPSETQQPLQLEVIAGAAILLVVFGLALGLLIGLIRRK